MQRPNVVFILADDLGYGDFAAFNGGLSQTPRLDALMGESLCLSHHYAASTVCAPSRAGLLTGRYPHRTGALDTLEGRGGDRLALREVTLADTFRQAGYATGLFGKWHLGAFDPRFHPNRRGFEEFTGFRGGWSDYRGWRLERNGQRLNADGRYLTDVFSDEAVDFIHRRRKEPFFLHVTFNAPHTPLQAPESDIQPFVEAGRVPFPVAVLYGMIRRLDAGVGRILDALDAEGLRDHTLVVFTSDNGPQFGSELGDLTRFNCNLNGRKGRVYEGGIRVPAILRWPDGLPGKGRNVDAFVHMTDWVPTLCALAGVRRDAGLPLDGQDVSPVLRGEPWNVDPLRFWQWNRYTPQCFCNAAMRDGDWKLVRPHIEEGFRVAPEDLRVDHMLRYEPDRVPDMICTPEPERHWPDPLPAPQLFHLGKDPGETDDLASREPARAARMLRALETWFESVEAERATIRD